MKLLGVTVSSLLVVLMSYGQAGVHLDVSERERLERQIVFESERNGHTEIYVMDVDGSNQQRLTYTVGDDRRSSLPHWSPDGRKIVFSTGPDRHMEIYVMDRDGSNVRQIWKAGDTQSEAWGPQWSPDGQRIVFVSDQSIFNRYYSSGMPVIFTAYRYQFLKWVFAIGRHQFIPEFVICRVQRYR